MTNDILKTKLYMCLTPESVEHHTVWYTPHLNELDSVLSAFDNEE